MNCIFLTISEICCSLKDKTFECHIPTDFGSKFTIVSVMSHDGLVYYVILKWRLIELKLYMTSSESQILNILCIMFKVNAVAFFIIIKCSHDYMWGLTFTKLGKWAVMYLCVRGNNFAPLHPF